MCGMLTDREGGKKEEEDHTDHWPMPVPPTSDKNPKRIPKNLEVLQNPKNMCGMLTDKDRGKKDEEDHTDHWPKPVAPTPNKKS